MNMMSKSIDEQLNIAKESTSLEELQELHTSQYMNVRRAVARNSNISAEIANNLVLDPVLNVSYMAYKNPKSTHERKFNETKFTDCVLCEKDERKVECEICENKKKTLLNT